MNGQALAAGVFSNRREEPAASALPLTELPVLTLNTNLLWEVGLENAAKQRTFEFETGSLGRQRCAALRKLA